MDQQSRGFNIIEQEYQKSQAMPVVKTFMANVFAWMTAAMVITSVTAYLFGTSAELISSLRSATGGMSGLGWIVMLAPIGFVLLMSMGFQRLSPAIMSLLFIAFSILMGMSLSFIFLVYTKTSIFQTFLISGGLFGIMAALGYTTKTDLTKFGSIMMMGLVGIFIAMMVNWFMHSETLAYLISIGGVLVFTGLTAYDVQKLKKIGAGIGVATGDPNARKLSILGALTLYLDFINLFLFLLRIMGDRR